MSAIVMKFGGTSLQDDDRVNKIADHIVAEKNRGSAIVAVVSARGHLTDHILAEVRALSGKNPDNQILDFAGPAGERISTACLAAAIKARGFEVVMADGQDIGLIASGQFGDGKVKRIERANIITSALDEGKIVILAAYAGITVKGQTITLGRGGSDTFAVAVAAAIKAKVCQIYTDVPGFFTVNPKIVPTAKMFSQITYWQAMALCAAGTQVLKERCITIAAGMNVPLQVLLSPSIDSTEWRNLSVDVDHGTWLSSGTSTEDMEAASLDQTGLAINTDITVFNLIGVPNVPGISYHIFEAIKKIPIGNVAQGLPPKNQPANVAFYVKTEDADSVAEALSEINLTSTVIERRDDLACLTLIDDRMITESGWIDRITGALAKDQINIEMHPTSGNSILIVVSKSHIKQAALAIAKQFDLCY